MKAIGLFSIDDLGIYCTHLSAGLHTHEVEAVDTKLAWESDQMLRTSQGLKEIAETLDKVICRTVPGGLAFIYLDYDVNVDGNPEPSKRLVARRGWEPGTVLAAPLHPTSAVPKAIVFAARQQAESRPPHLEQPSVFQQLLQNRVHTYPLEDGRELYGAEYLELQDERFVILGYNMHECRGTCWKKNPDSRKCRFGFPHELCSISTVQVAPSRTGESLKVQVNLRRDHSQVNSYIPLLARSLRCNTDAMYAGVVYGLLVYALSYSTKSDVPDMKLLSERILRSLKRMASQQYDQATYGDLMLAVANTMMGSREIGAPQALMFILGHRMKWVSKKVVRLDTSLPVLRRRFLCHQPDGLHDVPLVEREEADGYPIAPGVLLQESRSTYRNYKSYALRPLDVEVEMEVFGTDDYGQKKATKLILLRDMSFVQFLAHFEEEILNFNPALHTRLRNRRIQLMPDENGRRVWMRQRTRPAVIMFIPVFAISDHNDQSAYSLLVAHVPWQSESELVEGYESPITALEAKMHLFPGDIQRYFEHRRRFEAVLEETIAYSSALHAPQSHSSVRVYFHEDEEAFDAGRDADYLQAGDSVVDFVSIMDPDKQLILR